MMLSLAVSTFLFETYLYKLNKHNEVVTFTDGAAEVILTTSDLGRVRARLHPPHLQHIWSASVKTTVLSMFIRLIVTQLFVRHGSEPLEIYGNWK